MIGAEQIKVNFETFNGVLESSFEGDRLEKLNTLTECLKERMTFPKKNANVVIIII